MKRLFKSPYASIVFCIGLFCSVSVEASESSYNPSRSLYMGISTGAGMELDDGSRYVADISSSKSAAYSKGGFVFGLKGGFRFNEYFALELGWSSSSHNAETDWGGAAGYSLGHFAVRFALPTQSRQILVFCAGGTFGSFFYGDVAGLEQNGTSAVGARGGLVLEHELALGLVGLLEIAYNPFYRRGMGEKLYLYSDDGEQLILQDVRDFSKGTWVHFAMVTIGIQFEWIL